MHLKPTAPATDLHSAWPASAHDYAAARLSRLPLTARQAFAPEVMERIGSGSSQALYARLQAVGYICLEQWFNQVFPFVANR